MSMVGIEHGDVAHGVYAHAGMMCMGGWSGWGVEYGDDAHAGCCARGYEAHGGQCTCGFAEQRRNGVRGDFIPTTWVHFH